MADIKAGTYSPETARIIWEVVQYIRRNPSLLKSGHQPEPVQEIPCVMLAKVTEEVTARDTDDLGIGVAEMRWVPGEAGTDVTMEEYPDTPAAEVDVYNVTESAIAVDSVVPIVREFGSGKWIALQSFGCKFGTTKVAGLDADSEGQVYLREPTLTGWDDTVTEVDVWNVGEAIAGDTLVLLVPVDGRWVSLEVC